jgi:hypothetical protein
VNFNYFIDEATFAYMIEAVSLIATHGWRLLPLYTFELGTGLWRHRDGFAESPLSLFDIDYSEGRMDYRHRRHEFGADDLREYLEASRVILEKGTSLEPQSTSGLTDDFEHLRWFPLPSG